MENNIEERSDYGSIYELIEEADKHRPLFGYPELYQALQKFDTAYSDDYLEPSDVDRVFDTIAKFVHSKLSQEEVAILAFLRKLIEEESSMHGYNFVDPLFDGVLKLLKQAILDKDMLAACDHLVTHIQEYTIG